MAFWKKGFINCRFVINFYFILFKLVIFGQDVTFLVGLQLAHELGVRKLFCHSDSQHGS